MRTNKRQVAKGAFFIVIGLVAFRFGTAYASAWYAHEGSIPGFAWIAMVMGILSVIAGIRDCIIGVVGVSDWYKRMF